MKKPRLPVGRRGLVVELSLWMLVISLVPVALTVYLSNLTFESALSNEVRARLERIASESTRRLDAYVNGMIAEVGLVADSAVTAQVLADIGEVVRQGKGLKGPDYALARATFDDHLSALRGRKNWTDVLLVDRQGLIVYTARGGEELGQFVTSPRLVDTELARSVNAANTLLQSEVSNFAYYEPAKSSAAFLAAPVFEDRVIVGNIVMRIDPRDMQAILADASGLGKTGEVIAGAIDDDTLQLFSSLSDPRPTQSSENALAARYWPLNEALQGREGAGQYIDDRGVSTEAAWRYVPSLNWGMLAKIDSDEVYAASRSFRLRSGIIVLVALLFVAIGAYLCYRAISRPIVRLAALVGSLTGDQLPHQIPVNARNEIGILIEAFNRLIARQREHQGALEKTVQQRTAALRDSETKLRQYLRIVDDNVPTLTFDARRVVRSVSDAFCRLVGQSRIDLIGTPLRQLIDADHSDRELDQIWTALEAGEPWRGELKYRRDNGPAFHVDEVFTPEFEDGVLARVTTVLRDITDRKRVEVLSITDELTGLYNRRHLNAVYVRELSRARRDGRGLGLLVCDVDYFKRYNDHYGHLAGDVVLQRLAGAVRDAFKRAGDLAFRLGGEEFGVLVAVQDETALRRAGERLIAAVAVLRITHDGSEIAPIVTISCGAALTSAEDLLDLDDLYLRADQALYQAKQAGRNRVVCWQPPSRVPASQASTQAEREEAEDGDSVPPGPPPTAPR